MTDPAASKDMTISAPPALAHASAIFPIKLTVTMPVEWMLTGFAGALDRIRAAAADPQQENARDICIALFEAGNWLHSLADRFPRLKSSPHVRAFLFARNRTHHNFAAALFFDQKKSEWTWYKLPILPIPEKAEHFNPKGERAYEQVAAERPLRDTLARVEQAVSRLSAT